MPYLAAFVICLFVFPAAAQQPDYQRLIPALEAQRNQALTNHALAEARILALQEENEKLKKELEELRKTAKPAK